MPKDSESDYDREAVAAAFEDGLDEDLKNFGEAVKRIETAQSKGKKKLPPPSGPFRDF